MSIVIMHSDRPEHFHYMFDILGGDARDVELDKNIWVHMVEFIPLFITELRGSSADRGSTWRE